MKSEKKVVKKIIERHSTLLKKWAQRNNVKIINVKMAHNLASICYQLGITYYPLFIDEVNGHIPQGDIIAVIKIKEVEKYGKRKTNDGKSKTDE